MIHLVTYDLHKPDRDYKDVIAKIKTFGSWAHPEESVWIVDTKLNPVECRAGLNGVTTEATYFVVPIGRGWAAHGLSKGVTDWLKDPNRTW